MGGGHVTSQVKRVCALVRIRAARLVAAAIAAMVAQQGHTHPTVDIAIDGGAPPLVPTTCCGST